MYLMVDNKDSFVYNLVAYFEELGHNIKVLRMDKILISELNKKELKGIIISPGPGKPEQSEVSLQILETFKNKVPVLGVCLGHQVIAHGFGGVVCKGEKPMHGKVTPISHSGKRLFKNLPKSFMVTRYHSLVVKESTILEKFYVDSSSDDGTVMAISHKQMPIYGIQFHPEALLSEFGYEILENFNELCEKWWNKNA